MVSSGWRLAIGYGGNEMTMVGLGLDLTAIKTTVAKKWQRYQIRHQLLAEASGMFSQS